MKPCLEQLESRLVPDSIPILNSLPGAPKTLYLDFDGYNGTVQKQFAGPTLVVMTPFDINGDTSTYDASEVLSMTNMWAVVAEDFAPFNVNVTTVNPGALVDNVSMSIVIGECSTSCLGGGSGTVAGIGAFTDATTDNLGVVYPSLALYNTASLISHESGHLLGLTHDFCYTGEPHCPYGTDPNGRASIMWSGYLDFTGPHAWTNGVNAIDPVTFERLHQDSVGIILSQLGARADDYGCTLPTAGTVTSTGTTGIIGSLADSDCWVLTVPVSGNVTLNVVRPTNGNADVRVDIYDSVTLALLISLDPTDSYDVSGTAYAAAGTYYVQVLSSGDYGEIGQYTISATVPMPSLPGWYIEEEEDVPGVDIHGRQLARPGRAAAAVGLSAVPANRGLR